MRMGGGAEQLAQFVLNGGFCYKQCWSLPFYSEGWLIRVQILVNNGFMIKNTCKNKVKYSAYATTFDPKMKGLKEDGEIYTVRNNIIYTLHQYDCSRASSVDTPTRLGAGRPRSRSSITGKARAFFSSCITFRPALGSTQPPVKWVAGAVSLV
jgi:hypothetical protein